MAEVGILQDRGIELINGEIIEMSPIGSRHASLVDKLGNLLSHLLFGKMITRVQNPIVVSDLSEPEPDLTILKYRDDFYADHHPRPDEVLLIIEVADTSVAYDRQVKLPIYASAGIPEFWLINLEQNEIEAYWQPHGDAYRFRELLRPGDVLKARHFELSLPVRDILG